MSMAGVERIHAQLDVCSSSRFFVLYGPGIEDIFMARNYTPLSFEQALHQVLIHNGFERVAFWAPHRKVFYLDAHSEAAAQPSHVRPMQPAGQPLAAPANGGAKMGSGPLQDRLLYKPQAQAEKSVGQNAMGDVAALRLIDALIQDLSTAAPPWSFCRPRLPCDTLATRAAWPKSPGNGCACRLLTPTCASWHSRQIATTNYAKWRAICPFPQNENCDFAPTGGRPSPRSRGEYSRA